MKDKEELKKYRVKKPLYKEIEDKYEQNVIMPEFEKRKEELRKRRECFSSVN